MDIFKSQQPRSCRDTVRRSARGGCSCRARARSLARRQAIHALGAGGDEPEYKMNAGLSDIHGAQPVEFVID
jgi:hypothetical protein